MKTVFLIEKVQVGMLIQVGTFIRDCRVIGPFTIGPAQTIPNSWGLSVLWNGMVEPIKSSLFEQVLLHIADCFSAGPF